MWAISMKRVGRLISMERPIPGNQLITNHDFHGYSNWKLQVLGKPNRCLGINMIPVATHKGREELLGHGDSYPGLLVVIKGSIFRILPPTRVESGSNTSSVTLRVTGGDEEGSLKSESVKYGHVSNGTWTQERLRWRGPAAYTKDRPVLSSEKAPHINRAVIVKD
jgi:hypothetical protein